MKAGWREWPHAAMLRDCLKAKRDKDMAANYALAIEAALDHER